MAANVDRWRRFVDFAAEWRRPIKADDGVPIDQLDRAEERLNLRLPEALRELYLMAGRRRDLFKTMNRLLAPREIGLVEDPPGTDENGLIFYTEEDGAVQWGIRMADIHLADPPVCLDNSEPVIDHLAEQVWLKQNETLSEFVYQMMVVEAAWRGKRDSAHAWVQPDDLDAVTRRFDPMLLPAWHWPSEESRLWSASGVFMLSGRDLQSDDLVEVVIGGRTLRELRAAMDVLPVKWD